MELGQWFSEVYRTSCEVCRDAYGPENTPCGPCWPGVHQYNNLAVNIFSICSNQYIMGPSGPVEIDMKTVFTIMDTMDVDQGDRLDVWGQVRKLSNCVLSEQREDRERKAKIEKARGRV